ncbi:MAG: thymidine phosphorylase [Clostridiales bacterium]|nr:thymidine phosphorylase [Clostridiales bacterium]
MRAYDVIKKKRDGFELSFEELNFIVKGAVSGEIKDYQISAFLMAVYFNGMTERETLDFTLAIANSGEKFIAKGITGVKADKHSTGGVGDKTSLIISPVLASLGVFAIKMSGRGLGHTGGTVDKLESIKGYKVELSTDEFLKIAKKCGVSIIGQTGDLAPADKIFYSLRDVTATIDSIPLIASSIMGKKLTADDDVIVLDVKTGNGAFMKDLSSAEDLAKVMVNIGKGAGKKITALITDMNEPLGNYVGNALEIKEVLDVLAGKVKNDLYDVSKMLTAEILYLSGYGDREFCKALFDKEIENGKALCKFKEFVAYQGGDLTEILSGNYCASKSFDVLASESGFLIELNAEKVGISSLLLGAGRNKKEDKIDYLAGIILHKKVGDKVEKGEKLATLYSSNESLFSSAIKEFLQAVKILGDKLQIKSKIIKTIE